MTLLTEVVDRIIDHGRERPDAVALVETGGRQLTYRQLAAQLQAVQAGLVETGLQVGQRVRFGVRPSLEHYLLILAIVRAGGILLAIDQDQPRCADGPTASWMVAESKLVFLASQAWSRWLLRRVGVRLPGLTRSSPETTVLVGPRLPGQRGSRRYRDLLRGRPWAERTMLPPECPLLVVQTSGTTDRPKYAVHTNASLGASMAVTAQELSLGPADVVFGDQLHLVVPALLAGARVVVPVGRRRSAASWLRQVQRQEATYVTGTPADFQTLIEHCQRRHRRLPNTLRVVLLGSAPIYRSFVARLRPIVPPGTTIWCVYAMTEMMPVCRVGMDEKLGFTGDGDLVGHPCRGIDVRVAEDGELLLRGPNLFSGYWGEPPVTELRSGDLGQIDQDGRVILLGRKKDMLIRGHQNIYPALIEPRIEQLEGVQRCALVGLYDETVADELVVLVVEPEASERPINVERRVRRAISDGLLEPHLDGFPDLVVVAPLPLVGRSRKVDKSRLREQLRSKPGQPC